MKNKFAHQILEETPKKIKNKIAKMAEAMINNQPIFLNNTVRDAFRRGENEFTISSGNRRKLSG